MHSFVYLYCIEMYVTFFFVARKRKMGHNLLGLGRNGGDKQLESAPVMGSGDSEWSCSYLLWIDPFGGIFRAQAIC